MRNVTQMRPEWRDSPRRLVGRNVSLLLLLTILAAHQPANAYTLSGGGVWDIPNSRRVAFDPSTGAIGNMGSGVIFSVGAPPDAAQAGAAAQATTAFDTWNATDTLLTRINLVSDPAGVAKVPLVWVPVAGTPGLTTNAGINFDPRQIQLDRTRAIRTDRWSLDFAATRPDFISEYDVYTTTVHEIGHAIGLGHTGTAVVMTPQDTARQNAAGSWRTLEQTTPFAGQPTNLAGAALADGTLAYRDPRASLAADDITGARTLYSAPLATIRAFFSRIKAGLVRYFYKWTNDSDSGADYFAREITVPVPSNVTVTDIRLGSFNELPVDKSAGAAVVSDPLWQIERTQAGVRIAFAGPGGLAPDAELDFSFVANAEPTTATPWLRWTMLDLESGLPGGEDGSSLDDPVVPPAFNPADFSVLDGTYTYSLVGDAWQLVPFDAIAVPGNIPAPPTWMLVLSAALGLVFMRSRRRERPW